jgi:hypothetical protein
MRVILTMSFRVAGEARREEPASSASAKIRVMIRHALPVFILAIASAQSQQSVEITAEPHHHLVLENSQVRVFYVNLPPQESTLEHWHRHDYIYIGIGNAQIVNTVKGKDPVPGKLGDGETGLASGNFEHTVRNVSTQPFRNVDVELLQDDKLRAEAAAGKFHWDDERSLDVLHGGAGTREILWVKDGVRATEIELQPAGMLPSQHYRAMALLIAVSDLDLEIGARPKPPTRPSAPLRLRAGDTKLLFPGDSGSLMNMAHANAKFVTLELP